MSLRPFRSDQTNPEIAEREQSPNSVTLEPPCCLLGCVFIRCHAENKSHLGTLVSAGGPRAGSQPAEGAVQLGGRQQPGGRGGGARQEDRHRPSQEGRLQGRCWRTGAAVGSAPERPATPADTSYVCPSFRASICQFRNFYPSVRFITLFCVWMRFVL